MTYSYEQIAVTVLEPASAIEKSSGNKSDHEKGGQDAPRPVSASEISQPTLGFGEEPAVAVLEMASVIAISKQSWSMSGGAEPYATVLGPASVIAIVKQRVSTNERAKVHLDDHEGLEVNEDGQA